MDPTKAGALTLLSFILFLIFAQTDMARATAISLRPRTPAAPEPVPTPGCKAAAR